MKASDIKGKVDFGIITIRGDEFKAVLKRFPHHDDAVGERTYSINHTEAFDSDQYLVAVLRLPEQGEGPAQDAARDLIADLDPQWLVLVGIGAAVPHDEFTLGDVVIATRVYDFCVEANFEDRAPQFSVAGGPMHKEVEDLLAHLPAMEDKLEGWNNEESIGMQRPQVQLKRTDCYGSEEWQKEVRRTLGRHFGRADLPRSPLFTARPVASSDRLVKDSKTVQAWRETARHICAIEMELAGVYRAARRREHEYPILAIRGISDIVGFRRRQDWTEYACHSAASFAYALIRAKPITPRSGPERKRVSQEAEMKLEAGWRHIESADFEDAARLSEEAVELAHQAGDSSLERKARKRALRTWHDHVATSSHLPPEDVLEYQRGMEAHLRALESLHEDSAVIALERAYFLSLSSPEEAIRYARQALTQASDWKDRADAMSLLLNLYYSSIDQGGEALGLGDQVKDILNHPLPDQVYLVLSASWLRTLCKAGKLAIEDCLTFSEVMRQSFRQSPRSAKWIGVIAQQAYGPILAAKRPDLALPICEAICEIGEEMKDPVMAWGAAGQTACVAAAIGDRVKAVNYLGKAESWLSRVGASGGDNNKPRPDARTNDRAIFLFMKADVLFHLVVRPSEAGEPTVVEQLQEAHDAIIAAEKFISDAQDDVRDSFTMLSELRWWLGRSALVLGQHDEAASAFKAVRSPPAMIHAEFANEIGAPAWFMEAKALYLGVKPLEASNTVGELIASDLGSEGLKAEAQQLRQFLEHGTLALTRWFESENASEIGALANRQTLRQAVAEQVEPLVRWWRDWHRPDSGPESELLDMWGRGGLARIAAAVRAKSTDAVAVDAQTVAEIRQWARILCPLFDTVIVKWKGTLGQGVVIAPLEKAYLGPGAFGGAGYLVASDEMRAPSKGACEYVSAMAWANPLPREVSVFLAGEAIQLVASGRLIVLPAPLAGCTQSAVGWTDHLLTDGFLGGVVDVVRLTRGMAAGGLGSQRVLDLSKVSIPFIADVALRDLAEVLDETDEEVYKLRSVWSAYLRSGDLQWRRWESNRVVGGEIRDAFKEIAATLRKVASGHGWRIDTIEGGLSAAEYLKDKPGMEPMTDLLRSVTVQRPATAPWIPYWRLAGRGGYLQWTSHLDNPSKPPPKPQPRELHTWLCSPEYGWSIPLVRGPDSHQT